jgi:hypothetical protein
LKGYVNVSRSDLLAAIIGFEVRYDVAKELRDKGIKLYYEKHYLNGSAFTKWWHRKKTVTQFARSRLSTFGHWTDILHEVLTTEECDEIDWWSCTWESKIKPIKALYDRCEIDETVLVDNEMAAMITKYKDYLEGVK